MKRILAVLMVMCLCLTACARAGEKAGDPWGIYLSAKDITPEGLTLLIEQKGGNPSGELQTGDWFKLEEKTEDGWAELSTNPLIDYAWHMVAYGIKKDDITELPVEWEWLYGYLGPGEYRLSKEIQDFRGAGDFDEKVYTYEFCLKKADVAVRCPVGEDY